MSKKTCPNNYYSFEECQELLFCTEDFCSNDVCPYSDDEDRQWMLEKEPWLFEKPTKKELNLNNINIKTSYFAKYKKENGVSIALSTPNWFQGEEYKKLAPPKKLLYDYKSRLVDKEEYKNIYLKEVLNRLDPKEVAKDLNDKVLLCYEKAGDFCHRRLVAEWLEENLNIKVEEIQIKKEKFKQVSLF